MRIAVLAAWLLVAADLAAIGVLQMRGVEEWAWSVEPNEPLGGVPVSFRAGRGGEYDLIVTGRFPPDTADSWSSAKALNQGFEPTASGSCEVTPTGLVGVTTTGWSRHLGELEIASGRACEVEVAIPDHPAAALVERIAVRTSSDVLEARRGYTLALTFLLVPLALAATGATVMVVLRRHRSA